jgi:hypothetical protein
VPHLCGVKPIILQVLTTFCLARWGPGFAYTCLRHTLGGGGVLVVTELCGIHCHNHYLPNLGLWTWRNSHTFEKILSLDLDSVAFCTLFSDAVCPHVCPSLVYKHYYWPVVTRAEFIIQELQLLVAVELFREQVTIDLARCAIDTAREQLPLWPQLGHLGR